MLIKKQTNVKNSDGYLYTITVPTKDPFEIRTDNIVGRALVELLITKQFFHIWNIPTFDTYTDMIDIIIKYANNITDYYYISRYRYIPVYDYTELTDSQYEDILSKKVSIEFGKYVNIFQRVAIDGLELLTNGRTLSIDTNKTGSDTLSKEYGSTINGKNDYSSMHENSPINADLGVINTPNEKQVNKNSNESKKTGKDEFKTTYGSNVSDIHTETSPDFYRMFIKLLEEYNISKIIEKVYRRIIHEFNQSL